MAVRRQTEGLTVVADGKGGSRLRCLSLAFVVTAILFGGTAERAYGRRWNFNSTDEGWTLRNAIRNVGDGNLYVDPTGADPGAVSPIFSESASASRVTIRMSSWCPDRNGKIYFTTVASPSFSASKSVAFSVSGGQTWTTYSVLMTGNGNWTGTITQIRIDPCDNGVAGTSSDIVGFSWVEIATTACSPNCMDKCNAALDGCGGTCTEPDPCTTNQVCYSQTCTTIIPSLSITPNPVNVGGIVAFTCSLGSAGAGLTVGFFVDNALPGFLAQQQMTADAGGQARWTKTNVPSSWAPSVTVRCRAESVSGKPTSIWETLTVNRVPAISGSLVQYHADGVTSMTVGALTRDTTLVMKATSATDPDGNHVALDVEVRPVGQPFSNVPTCTSNRWVPSGGVASATCSGLGLGSYHWQARARDSGGATSNWLPAGGNSENQADFTIVANRAPTIGAGTLIQYPADGATSLPVGASTTDTTLVMKGQVWDSDDDAVQIEVEIRPVGTAFSDAPTCTSSTVASGTVAAATCGGLGEGDYHWQARPHDSLGLAGSWASAGGNSETIPDFTIVLAPSGPTLLNPAPGEAIPFPAADLDNHKITFQWSPVPDATGYELYVDNNAGFGSPEIQELGLPADHQNQCAPPSPSSTECTTPSNYFEQNLYYWKLRACFASGACSDWSETRTFTVTYDDYPVPVFVPFRRWYHPSDHDHYYTTSLTYNPAGYQFEKVEAYVSDRPFPGSVPLMKLYHPAQRAHRYVVTGTKRDEAIRAGYTYEGIVGCAYATAEFGTVGLRHLYKGSPDYDDFLAVGKAEIENAISTYGFSDQNGGQPIAYVSPTGLANPVGQRRLQGSIGGVDSGTGAFRDSYAQQALAYHGYGPPFAFVLHYNSQNRTAVPISPGWSHSLYSFVVEAPNGDVVVKWGDGSESFFVKQPDGTFRAGEAGNYDALTCVAPSGAGCIIDPVNRGYNLVRKDQSRFIFREIPVNTPSVYVPSVALIRVEDRHGNAITVSYLGDSGRIQWARDAAGRQLDFAYDAQYRLTQVHDSALGRDLYFDYDAAGNVWHFTDARGKVTTFTHDADHRLLTVTRPRGNTPRTVEYDALGRVRNLFNEFGNALLNVAYDVGGVPGQTHLTVPGFPGRQMDFAHLGPGGTQAFQLSGLTDAYGRGGSMTYADASNPTLPTAVTNLRGKVTQYAYDGRGNVRTITNADGKTASLTYDAYNNVTSYTDFGSLIRTTAYTWDGAGKTLLDINAPEGRNTHFAYNAKDLPVTVRDGRGYTTTYGYDGQLNLTSVADPEGNTTQYGHDVAGRLTSVTDAKLKTTSYQYDENDNLVEVKDQDQHVVSLLYDANNNLEQISYLRGGVQDTIRYSYDTNDQLKTVTDPWNGVYRYEYDDAGGVTKRTDPKSQVTFYRYDNNGRLQRIDYQPTGAWVQFGYDENGNLTSMDESWNTAGSHTFRYDNLDRLNSHTNTFGLTVGYGYDDAGNRTSITYPGNKTVQYQFDLGNRRRFVTDWDSKVIEYRYDNADNLTLILNSSPNNTRTTFNYDRASRLTGILHQKGDLSTIARFDFTLDRVGNHLSETTVGLLTPPAEPQADISYTIGKDNRLMSSSDGISYTYDANGKRIGKNGPAGSVTYAYDPENRLTEVSGPGVNVQYVYDGLGNRIARTEWGTTTRYVLDLSEDMSHVLMETDGANNPLPYYVYGNGLAEQITPGGQHYIYHGDSRGSVVAMTDSAGNRVQRYVYDEFGAVLAEQGSVVTPFKYVGQWGVMAEPDGLQFMRARFYDERVGAFLTKDPLGFEGGDWDLYGYAGASPLVNVDPSGATFTKPEFLRFGNYCGPFYGAGEEGTPLSGLDTWCKAHDWLYGMFGYSSVGSLYADKMLLRQAASAPLGEEGVLYNRGLRAGFAVKIVVQTPSAYISLYNKEFVKAGMGLSANFTRDMASAGLVTVDLGKRAGRAGIRAVGSGASRVRRWLLR